MIVLNLCCSSHHRFEGWFASNDAFRQQAEQGLLNCPLCGDHEVTRLPSSPRIRRTATRASETGDAPRAAPVSIGEAAGSILALMRQILDASEDVGERFPEEARRIHYEEAPSRTIRGLATREETDELEEEGIMVVALPIPPTRDMH
jgi:hypothetical protein